MSGLNDDIIYQEWKACRDALGAFDNILVDLRKYGFSLVTILLSADGFLFVKTDLGVGAILGIYVALLVLICGLFRIDRVHEIFIRATVMRAMALEKKIEASTQATMGLTLEIATWSEKLRTGTWGHILYILFCFAAYVLAEAGIFSRVANHDKILLYSAAATSAGLVASLSILIQHDQAKVLGKEFVDAIRKYGARDDLSHEWSRAGWAVMLLLYGFSVFWICYSNEVNLCDLYKVHYVCTTS